MFNYAVAVMTTIGAAKEMYTLVFTDAIVLVEDFVTQISAVWVKEILDDTAIFKYFSTDRTRQIDL